MTTFRSDDGREIDEADVRALARLVELDRGGVTESRRIIAALYPKPKTCGAEIPPEYGDRFIRCCLPPPDKDGFHEGHHAFKAPTGNFGNYVCQRMWPTVLVQQCSKPESDSVHWKGHAPDPSVWQEP